MLRRQENLGQYLTKGKQVYVEGRLSTRSYDDKDGKKVYQTEVVADEVILLGAQGNGSERPNTRLTPPVRQGASTSGSRGRTPAATDDDPKWGVTDDDAAF